MLSIPRCRPALCGREVNALAVGGVSRGELLVSRVSVDELVQRRNSPPAHPGPPLDRPSRPRPFCLLSHKPSVQY